MDRSRHFEKVGWGGLVAASRANNQGGVAGITLGWAIVNL